MALAPRMSCHDLTFPHNSNDDSAWHSFGLAVVQHLAHKGHCIIQSGSSSDDLKVALDEVVDLDNVGLFNPPPAEVVDGLLGAEGSSRIAQWQVGQGPAHTAAVPQLTKLDMELSSLAAAISPFTASLIGTTVAERTPPLLHESGNPREPFPFVSAQEALSWQRIFAFHRILCLTFLGPEEGILELQPFDHDADPYSIELEAGTAVVMRTDVLSQRLCAKEECYSLSCHLLDSRAKSRMVLPAGISPSLGVGYYRGGEPGAALRALELALSQGLGSGPGVVDRAHIGQVAIRGAAALLPRSLDAWCLWAGLSHGLDGAVAIPVLRWDHEPLWDPDVNGPANGKMACRHAAIVDGVELFDHRFFRISPLEAATVAPEQRKVLEVGYEVMYAAGFTKAAMEKTLTGVFAGAQWNEWNVLSPMDSSRQGSFGATSNMTPITANRLSYLLGLNGPSMTLDTEGSSSLVAVCKGKDALSLSDNRRTVDMSLCLGVSILLSPAFLVMHAKSGHLSARGRCTTFDARADGYIVGDGCGGVLLAPFADGHARTYDSHNAGLGTICAARMGSVGHSSGLGAPSGPADRQLLAEAAEAAGCRLDALECHGASGLLGDAVEVASALKALRPQPSKISQSSQISQLSQPSRPRAPQAPTEAQGLSLQGLQGPGPALRMGAVKTAVGNARACAGMNGLLAVIAANTWGVPVPMLHFRSLNPYFEPTESMLFATESGIAVTKNTIAGVTSKGFGGTIAHVVASIPLNENLRFHFDTSECEQPEVFYWPGGGGMLHPAMAPRQGYWIVGSWTGWSRPERMQEEHVDTYGYSVQIGELGSEAFYICLDADLGSVLHPGTLEAAATSEVLGPDASANDCHWLIRGRPGDTYHIQFEVRGKWRSVKWNWAEDFGALGI